MRKRDGSALLMVLLTGSIGVFACVPSKASASPFGSYAPRTRATKQENPARAVFKKVVPSLVSIVALDQNNQPLEQGSGFYIKPHLLATNLHILRNAKSLRIADATTHKTQTVRGVQAVSVEQDLAILQIEETGTPLALATTPFETGDTVYALGNPIGTETALSAGIVSGLRKFGKTAMVQITVPISPGSSGGPVVNIHGEVIGVSTSYLVEGQSLNFAVDERDLARLMASRAGKNAQPLSFLATLAPSPEEDHKSALQSLRITAPEVNWGHNPERTQHGLGWNLSVKNDGDRAVKSVDLLILIFDQKTKDMIHYVRKKLPITIPAKLAKRTTVDASPVDFDTDEAGSRWTFEYRILGFEYAPDQEP
ncbi:MAG: hypothetical protein JWL77_3569 [Chthonomonadaceae bacterium]|nr:hypothetical protein [Chthonomonadaceae bacterium]